MSAPGRPDTGWMDFYSKVNAFMGDSRNAAYKKASASGNRKQRGQRGAKPLGQSRIVGLLEPGPRGVDLLDSRLLRGVFLEKDEMTRRRELRKKTLMGDEDALAYFRDILRTGNLVLDGQCLISDGVLVGARR
jgi:hypothetical protein